LRREDDPISFCWKESILNNFLTERSKVGKNKGGVHFFFKENHTFHFPSLIAKSFGNLEKDYETERICLSLFSSFKNTFIEDSLPIPIEKTKFRVYKEGNETNWSQILGERVILIPYLGSETKSSNFNYSVVEMFDFLTWISFSIYINFNICHNDIHLKNLLILKIEEIGWDFFEHHYVCRVFSKGKLIDCLSLPNNNVNHFTLIDFGNAKAGVKNLGITRITGNPMIKRGSDSRSSSSKRVTYLSDLARVDLFCLSRDLSSKIKNNNINISKIRTVEDVLKFMGKNMNEYINEEGYFPDDFQIQMFHYCNPFPEITPLTKRGRPRKFPKVNGANMTTHMRKKYKETMINSPSENIILESDSPFLEMAIDQSNKKKSIRATQLTDVFKMKTKIRGIECPFAFNQLDQYEKLNCFKFGMLCNLFPIRFSGMGQFVCISESKMDSNCEILKEEDGFYISNTKVVEKGCEYICFWETNSHLQFGL